MGFTVDMAQSAQGSRRGAPERLGQRYSAERFLPEAGNTVVCHLDRADPRHGAILASRARMAELPEAERRIETPVASLHMTLFEGVIESRRVADAWPRGMDLNAPVEDVTERLAKRLRDFRAPPAFDVAVAGASANGLILQGARAADEAALKEWREALAEVFGYRQKAHDAYRFHMTFAYMVDWLPEAARAEWERALPEICAQLVREAPVIPLRAPAFCRFADMMRFEELMVLG